MRMKEVRDGRAKNFDRGRWETAGRFYRANKMRTRKMTKEEHNTLVADSVKKAMDWHKIPFEDRAVFGHEVRSLLGKHGAHVTHQFVLGPKPRKRKKLPPRHEQHDFMFMQLPPNRKI